MRYRATFQEQLAPDGQRTHARGFRLLLTILLASSIVGVFVADAVFGVDWELLSTKHYWEAGVWYYGGYAKDYIKTPEGNRAIQREGVTNYTNLFALQESLLPGKSQHHVRGFPGTERLLATFILYLSLHLTGKSISVLTLFWLTNVVLWLLSIFLTHRLAAYYFADGYSPWIAAILVALYPALTLTFFAIKQQPLGTVFFLAGILFYERNLKQRSFLDATISLTAVIFLGMFANGGGVFLAGYIFFNACWSPRALRIRSLVSLAIAAIIAKLWLSALGSFYHLPSVTETLHIDVFAILSDTWKWLEAWVAHRDISELRFLGYPGGSFFTQFLALDIRAFLLLHVPLLVTAIAGYFFLPAARMLLLIAIPLFMLGHAGTLLAGWRFHYGYLSFPAGILVILAASGTLGLFLAGRHHLFRAVAFVIIAVAVLVFTDLKKQAGIYYGGFPERYLRRVTVYYPDEADHPQY